MDLLYITSMLPFGRMEAFFIPELNALRDRGVRVLLVPMQPRGGVVHDDAAELAASAVTEHVLSPRVLWGALAESARRPVRAARAFATTFRSRSPRVLAKNLLVFPKGLWAARLARLRGVDHIHAQWGSSSSTIGLVASIVSGIPWSFTVHRWDIGEDNLLAEKAAAARFVRAISEKGRGELARRVRPEAVPRIRVVHMGVDPPEGRLAPVRTRPELRVITAANLFTVKGHRYLVRATELLRRRGVAVHVDIAGQGYTRPELEAEVRRAGLSDDVSFLGVVPHGQLLERLQQGEWDLMVLPSIVTQDGEQEGIPVSLVEAMARGVPVVSTMTGAIPELLQGGAGVLVPPASAEALAAALERLSSPAERRRYASRGRERALRNHSLADTVTTLLTLLEGVSPGPERDDRSSSSAGVPRALPLDAGYGTRPSAP